MIDREGFALKKEALALAETYVEPLCETYPPEKYIGQTGPSTLVSSSGTYIVTAAEQAVDLMIKLADWLLFDDDKG